MASRMPTRRVLLLAAMAPCCAHGVITEHEHVDPDIHLLDADVCPAGSADCEALSLRQLRGEPIQVAAAGAPQEENTDNAQTEVGDLHMEASVSSAPWVWNTWSIVAHSSSSGWAWDVVRVKFLTITGEELSPSTPGCHLVESGHVDVPGYGPQNAFSNDQSWWGGRKDGASDKFYLGVACRGDHKVAAVQLWQKSGDHSTHHVQIYKNHDLLATRWGAPTGALRTIWAGSFGLRLVAKSLSSGWAWDVRRLKVVLPDGGELQPNGDCHAVESGHVDVPGYEATNAFDDHGSWWGGRRDSAEDCYIGIACERPFAWPQSHDIYLDQLSGHYASEVEVQELTAFGWETKKTVHVGPGGLMPLV